MKPPFVRSPYNYDMNAAGDESGLECKDQTLTQQHMKDECDINVLVAKFIVTGEMPLLDLPPIQGDFTNVPTYQEALNLMVEARESFMQMPANVRSRFENDPGKFVDFASDPKNNDELRTMGLWSPESVAAFEAKQKALLAENTANAAAAAELKALKKGQADNPKGVS